METKDIGLEDQLPGDETKELQEETPAEATTEVQTEEPEKPPETDDKVKSIPERPQVIPFDQFTKMQSTFHKKVNSLKRENRLMAAALRSRQNLDPMDEQSRIQPTKEEQAYFDYLEESEKEDQKERQQEDQATATRQELLGMWIRLRDAGIDPSSPEITQSVGRMWESGDIEGAKAEAATLIAEKRLEKRIQTQKNSIKQKAKEEGSTVVDKSGPTAPPGAGIERAKQTVNDYCYGRVSRVEYEAACKTLGKTP